MSTTFLGGGFDFVKDTFDSLTGKTSAKASRQAAQTQAQAQQNALNYLREREQVPQQFREGALTQLGGLFGLEGGDANAMAAVRQNPIYQATLGQIPQQEEAILRNQAATGALRTGATEAMLAENQRQNELSALQNTIGGLQGLAGLQSYAPQIAQGIAGIGQTQAQGITGAANAQQQALGGLLQFGGQLGAAAFSDIRLKSNVKPAGQRYGHDWFTWEWNEKANALGLFGEDEGVIADYVKQTRPDLVSESNGYLTVNYRELENG